MVLPNGIREAKIKRKIFLEKNYRFQKSIFKKSVSTLLTLLWRTKWPKFLLWKSLSPKIGLHLVLETKVSKVLYPLPPPETRLSSFVL